jgi:hypothetical protein
MAIVNSRAAIEPKTGTAAIFVNETIHSLMRKLFSNGEQGFFYDPNDLSTMYQDAAGTIPVTAAGQPVGLIRDKSGRNNHAFQNNSASRPILRQNAITKAYYLEFDGTDDFLQTNNINFTATDKVSLFSGVRKLSDAIQQCLVELSIGAQNGSFSIWSPSYAKGKNFAFWSKGTVLNANAYNTDTETGVWVVTGHGDILNKTAELRVNGVRKVLSNADQGTGNYGNHPLYIGRRNGNAFTFSGHIYSLVGIGRLTTNQEITALEKLIAKNTGVTLSV